MRFRERVIVVTGGGSGIGEAIVKRVSSEGAHVAVLDVNEDAARRVAEENRGHAYLADVTDAEALIGAFRQVVSDFGRLDAAVNNAGVGGGFSLLAEYPIEAWHKTIAVNLSGVFFSMRAEIPHMIRGGGGAIVNMASVGGLVGYPGISPYVAAKHGVLGLTKNAALEYGRKGIRVNAVCPTFVRTPLTVAGLPNPEDWAALEETHATGRCATAEEVAAMTAFLLSDEAASVTGSAHSVDGGVTAA